MIESEAQLLPSLQDLDLGAYRAFSLFASIISSLTFAPPFLQDVFIVFLIASCRRRLHFEEKATRRKAQSIDVRRGRVLRHTQHDFVRAVNEPNALVGQHIHCVCDRLLHLNGHHRNTIIPVAGFLEDIMLYYGFCIV